MDRLRRLAKESKAVKPDPVDAAAPEETAPGSAEAVTPEPASVEASLQPPTFDEPTFEEPSFQPPTFDEPTFEEPSFHEVHVEEPAFVEPVPAPPAEVPATDEPDLEAPAVGSVDEPAPVATPEAEVPSQVLPPPSERPDPPAAARRSEPAPADETPVAAPASLADESAEPVAVPAQPRSAASGRLVAVTGVLGLLVVLAVVGLILAVHHEHSTNSPAQERDEATAAAVKVVADTTTFDYRNADDWLRRVQADSTAGLRTDYANQKDLLTQATTTGKSVAVGKVVSSVYCGGQCASAQVAGNTAAALVYIATTVTSTSTPAGLTSKTRFTVKLIKVNGTWLATNVDPVAAAATS